MAFVITEECIGCDACLPVCPTAAVVKDDPIYTINSELCTECIVDHPEARCLAVCPVNSIIINEDLQESYEQLLDKRNHIFAGIF